jgi:hypothetical protein
MVCFQAVIYLKPEHKPPRSGALNLARRFNAGYSVDSRDGVASATSEWRCINSLVADATPIIEAAQAPGVETPG